MNGFVLGILIVVTASNLKSVWQTRNLKQTGIRVNGTITGSKQDKSTVTYKAQFITLYGQMIEGESSGWRFTDAEYFPGEEVVVIYNANHPMEFMLERELGNISIYGRAVIMIALAAIAAWELSYQAIN